MTRTCIVFSHWSALSLPAEAASAFVSVDARQVALPAALAGAGKDAGFWGPVAAAFGLRDQGADADWLGVMSAAALFDLGPAKKRAARQVLAFSAAEAEAFGWTDAGVAAAIGALDAARASVLLGARAPVHAPGAPDLRMSNGALLAQAAGPEVRAALSAAVQADTPTLADPLEAVLDEDQDAPFAPFLAARTVFEGYLGLLEAVFPKMAPVLGQLDDGRQRPDVAGLLAGVLLEAYCRALPEGSVLRKPVVRRGFGRAQVHPAEALARIAQQRRAAHGARDGSGDDPKINVVLAIDDAYAPHAAATITSALDHARAPGRYRFYILNDGGLSAQARAGLADVAQSGGAAVAFVEVGAGWFEGLPLNRDHVSQATYYRLGMGEVLPQAVSRVIYLDADVVVTDDLALLWDEDMGGRVLGAAPDEGGGAQGQRLQLPVGHRYFNAGVLLIDLAGLRRMDLAGAVRETMARYGDVITLQDQDILNLIFAGRTHGLDLRWNANNRLFGGGGLEPAYDVEEGRAAAAAPGILHFTDRRKPWHAKNLNPLAELYWRYRNQTPFAQSGAARVARHLAGGARRLFSGSQRAADREARRLPRGHLLEAGRRYRLIGAGASSEAVTFCHPSGLSDRVLLPWDGFGRFVFAPMDHDVWLYGSPDEAGGLQRVVALGRGQADEDAARVHRRPYYAAPLHFGGCVYATGKCRKGAARERLAQLRGLDLGSEALATLAVSERMIGDGVGAHPPVEVPEGVRIGVALHLHYRELWPEFDAYLAALGPDITLHVTLTEDDPDLTARIKERFAGARVARLDNLGRDIRPFVEAVRAGVFDDCDLICKLHSKRSAFSGKDGWFGHQWRRRNLLDLLGPGQIEGILQTFGRRPEVGMLGSAGLRLQRGVGGRDPGHGASEARRKALCAAAGLGPEHVQEDFFAGTMFWVRRSALEALKTAPITSEDYTPEGGPVEDGFEHAVERFFADCVRGAGMVLDDVAPARGAGAPLRSAAGRLIAPRSQYLEPCGAVQPVWHKALPEDLAGRRVAVLALRGASFDASQQARARAAALREAGWTVVFGCACAEPDGPVSEEVLALADGVMTCGFAGFDPAVWAEALRGAPQIWAAERLVLAGAGGLHGEDKAWRTVMGTVMGTSADVWTARPEPGLAAERFHQVIGLGRRALAHGPLRETLTTALGWHAEEEAVYRLDLRVRGALAIAPDLSVEVGEALTGSAHAALRDRDLRLLRDFGVLGLGR